ncbi:MAG: hemerythrin domain-containing protein [Acidimicrobiales bacterium]
MDAITLLKNDHRAVEALFKRYEKAGDRAYVQKREIVDRISEELSKHAAIEEQYFYPVTRATVPAVADISLESLEEHHLVKIVLAELATLDPTDERFHPKVTVLIENVRHHIEEEEGDYFPKVRDELGRAALADLGEAMESAKAGAPTHPHPEMPDTPPGNLVGVVVGAVDRVTDTVSGIAQGGVTVIQELIARILRTKADVHSPTGTSDARKAAAQTRAGAEAAASGVERTAKAAASAVESTAKAARSSAKGTVTSARRSAKKTATTAKRGVTRTERAAKAGAASTRTTAKRAAKSTTKAAKTGR